MGRLQGVTLYRVLDDFKLEFGASALSAEALYSGV